MIICTGGVFDNLTSKEEYFSGALYSFDVEQDDFTYCFICYHVINSLLSNIEVTVRREMLHCSRSQITKVYSGVRSFVDAKYILIYSSGKEVGHFGFTT